MIGENVGEQLRVTLVATGIGGQQASRQQPKHLQIVRLAPTMVRSAVGSLRHASCNARNRGGRSSGSFGNAAVADTPCNCANLGMLKHPGIPAQTPAVHLFCCNTAARSPLCSVGAWFAG